MRVQLFEASTSYQVMVLAAAIDSGAFADADLRILLVTVNTPVPEIARRPDEDPALASLLGRFDRVVSLNDLLAPIHPAAFRPRAVEQPLFERLLLRGLGIPEDATLELVVESVQAPPSRSLLLVFGSAEVTVYAEGLMSYGPTRDALPNHAASRIRRVLHLDLVPGLRPLLLTEHGVTSEVVPGDAFRAVVAEVAALGPPAVPEVPAPGVPYALVLGQYLAQLGLLTVREESDLLVRLVRAASDRGFEVVVVKPHPSAPPTAVAAARKAVPGVRVEVLLDAAPVEALYATRPPALVLGCFSTGLITASRFWGIPTATLGTAHVLDRLPRFQDSNRIPLAIVDRVVPSADATPAAATDSAGLQELVETVGYCMQWRMHPALRATAAAALAAYPEQYASAVPVARRRRLGLPGGWPLAVPAPLFARGVLRADRLTALRATLHRRLRP